MTDQLHAGNRRDRATIEDVAAAAGVSVATVSRALRGLPNVADSTRERVRQYADELAYRADPAASRLATGRSHSIAVAVPQLNGWYFSHVVAGVEAVCAEAGYDTIVIGLGPHGTDRTLLDGSDSLHRRVDGLIMVDVKLTDEEIAELESSDLAVVSVGPESAGIPSVGIDDVEVGRIGAQHLIDLGHRRIALVRGRDDDPYDFIVPHRRQHGFERACREAGIEPDERLYVSGNFTIQGGRDSVDALFDLDDPPTAMFALADEMAFGVLQGAAERGIHVPDELSVVGVDDHDVAAVVGLTTVHQDVEQHGARAARLIIDRLSGIAVPTRRENAPIRLVERTTTAPPRLRHSVP